jgi:hypothetical protein
MSVVYLRRDTIPAVLRFTGYSLRHMASVKFRWLPEGDISEELSKRHESFEY